MPTFTMVRPRGFDLTAASDFFAGFTPGSGMAVAAAEGAELTLAFRLDGTFAAVAARVAQRETSLQVTFVGDAEASAVNVQIARILGLEGDADAWAALGAKEPVVGRLQASFPGFFTAAKSSPYDAAAWAVLSPRMPMTQAARVKMAIAERLGDALTLDGRVHHVFPHPAALVDVASPPGVSDEKVARLRGVAAAALEGQLEAAHLRARGEAASLRDLQRLRGIGPWAASHVYYRGAAPIDELPTAEPRVLHGVAAAYGTAVHDDADLRRIAERWRPFRMWVAVLVARHLARASGWQAPGLRRERSALGAKLARRIARAST